MPAVRPHGVPRSLIRLLTLLAATAALVLAGCGGTSLTATPSPPPAITVEGSASGSTVTLVPGQELIVALATNPSTGFDWVTGTMPDPAILALAGEPGYTPSGQAGVIGAGGTKVMTYRAVAAGDTVLVLLYLQPWQSVTEDRFELAITVR